jgi:hypothetical protein
MPSRSLRAISSGLTSRTISTAPITKASSWLGRIIASSKQSEPFANPNVDPLKQPLDVGLTAAIHDFASEAMPQGWDVVENKHLAPSSLLDIETDMVAGRIRVWAGASYPNIYGEPADNYAFRAWHDYTHWQHHLPFDLAGEAGAAYVHVWQIVQKYGHDRETEGWATLMLTEVIGSCLAHIIDGEFPQDARAFSIKNADVYAAMAARLCVQLSGSDVTAFDALYLAERAFGRPYA